MTEELEEAREFGDEECVARIEDEIGLVRRELKDTYGVSGRKAGSAAEQTRVTVTKNIGRALDQIETKHESLGHFLKLRSRPAPFVRANLTRVSGCLELRSGAVL